MYAVIRTGGKQYKVKAGDLVNVELLEKSKGDEFDMDEVLFVSGKTSHVGAPTVSKAKVTVVVAKQDRAKKVLVFKKKRRKGYRKLQGHRQDYTQLFIKMIAAPDGESDSAEMKVKAPVEIKEEPKTKKAASKKASSKKKTAAKKATKKKTTKKKATKKKTTKKKA